MSHPEPRSQTVLVFGAQGQLAKALAHHAAQSELTLICRGRAQTNLEQAGRAEAEIQALKPEIVINAAAYTAVDQAEEDRDRCYQLNAYAPAEMARACASLKARFIHISTDYVFDGEAETPYTEASPPAPLNIYGHSKRAGEEAVLSAYPDAAIVRSSAIFSGNGDDFPSKMWALAHNRDMLKIVNDQRTGPTPASELARQVLKLAFTQDSGLFHCAGQPFVSWFEFAEAIFDLSRAQNGPAAAITPVSSSEFPTRARRPKASCLAGTRLETAINCPPPDWRMHLAKTLDAWKSKN